MKRLYLMIMLFAGCITMNAQGINGLDKQTRKYLETAEKYIEQCKKYTKNAIDS